MSAFNMITFLQSLKKFLGFIHWDDISSTLWNGKISTQLRIPGCHSQTFIAPQMNSWKLTIVDTWNLFILLGLHFLKLQLSCPQGLLKKFKCHILNPLPHLFPCVSNWTLLDVDMATTYTNYTMIWMHSLTMSLGRGVVGRITMHHISYYIFHFLLLLISLLFLLSPPTWTLFKLIQVVSSLNEMFHLGGVWLSWYSCLPRSFGLASHLIPSESWMARVAHLATIQKTL